MKQIITMILISTFVFSCKTGNDAPDASGTFEADEVIVSAEVPGRILSFNIEEGKLLAKNDTVGSIDGTNLELQMEQVNASIAALSQRTTDVEPQIRLLENQRAVQESQLATMNKEKKRTENLLKQDAATGKQLDDIYAQIDVMTKQIAVTKQQISVQKTSTSTQNRGILSESAPLKKRVAQLEDQLQKAIIINPVAGTVLAKYAEAGEVTATGKALYKVADLRTITLRAYATGIILPKLKIGQSVSVVTDDGNKGNKKYPGTITWISDKAEFTPKTIQTKEERANLVYAIKVKINNDGYVKIGMYGELQLEDKN
ncbi:MAG: HlyD family efflux transporter periplasmic adaptor subunit [Flavitalea sp.]